MTCKWKLIRQFHEGEYELTLGKNAIGRNVNSEVRCSSLFVSRTHCIIEVSEDLIKIIDNKVYLSLFNILDPITSFICANIIQTWMLKPSIQHQN